MDASDRTLKVLDFLLAPIVFGCGWLLHRVRRVGVHKLQRCKQALLAAGVFPIRNHYYEPQFDFREASRPLSEERSLPGIDWNVDGQLDLLESLSFADELSDLPRRKSGELAFYLDNGKFLSGDAEFWYQLIRLKKPRRIFEIGSGNSTLLAIRAISKNRQEDPSYRCRHLCIEPYEMAWLEASGVEVVRRRIEDVGVGMFAELEAGDILFIDSSHVIRPQGDVLFEYLELLPTLRPGVIVHVHDIFSPRNYPESWVKDKVRFWNEQYLLEAFLTDNRRWRIIGALNFLHHNQYERLKGVAPFLTRDREPGSLYLQKLG